MQRRESIRTCIACRKKISQSALLRIWSDSGRLSTSGQGRKGRSLYLCPHSACIEQGLKPKPVRLALRTTIEETCLRTMAKELNCKVTS